MPPAAAAFAKLVVPRLDGILQVKMVMERRVPRPKAYLVTSKYKAEAWLPREAARDRVHELLAAFDDLHEDDITPEFEVDLLNDGRSCSILSGSNDPRPRRCRSARVQSCGLADVPSRLSSRSVDDAATSATSAARGSSSDERFRDPHISPDPCEFAGPVGGERTGAPLSTGAASGGATSTAARVDAASNLQAAPSNSAPAVTPAVTPAAIPAVAPAVAPAAVRRIHCRRAAACGGVARSA
jgi:hypothetical protein